MKQGGLSGIIEAKKEDLGLFLPESKGGQDAIEPVDKEHNRSRSDLEQRKKVKETVSTNGEPTDCVLLSLHRRGRETGWKLESNFPIDFFNIYFSKRN